MTTAALGEELVRLLDLEHPPVAVAFHEREPPGGLARAPDGTRRALPATLRRNGINTLRRRRG